MGYGRQRKVAIEKLETNDYDIILMDLQNTNNEWTKQQNISVIKWICKPNHN
jgi:hypothetical protein